MPVNNQKPLWERKNPGVVNKGPATKITGDKGANTSNAKTLPVDKSLTEK